METEMPTMGIILIDTVLYRLETAVEQVVMGQDYNDVINSMTWKLLIDNKNWGLEGNINKTQYLCLGEQQKCLVMEDGTTIKHCHHINKLGINISDDGMLQ